MNRIFNRLLNVKNTVVEDACIVDSPLRPDPSSRSMCAHVRGHAPMLPLRKEAPRV